MGLHFEANSSAIGIYTACQSCGHPALRGERPRLVGAMSGEGGEVVAGVGSGKWF